MKFDWDEKFSVGNEEIDSQHKTWIGIYNDLVENMSKTIDKAGLDVKSEILMKISEYADYHFHFEEEYMRSIGYPDVDKHWRLHKDFRNEIYRIHRQYHEGSIVLSSEILSTIKNWLMDHILKEDMKIRRFIESGKQN